MLVVYKHTLEGELSPFYIGVGTEKRAYDFRSRSQEWKDRRQNKKVDVTILFKSEDRKEIYEKERYYINLYGRLNKKTGSLVNKTDGGGWLVGLVWSDERIKKIF